MLAKIHEKIVQAAKSFSEPVETLFDSLRLIKIAGELRKRISGTLKDNHDELARVVKVLDDFESFCAENLKIKTKDGALKPLILNDAQKRLASVVFNDLLKGKPVRVIILKARQMGFSTTTEAIIYYLSSLQEAKNAFIVAQDSSASENLYDMFRLYFESAPEYLKPMRKRNNSRRLTFENPTIKEKERLKEPGLKSKITVQSAENKVLARSETIHYLHVSELAFWPESKKKKHLAALFAALSKEPGTVAVVESTANGIEQYKEMWDNAVAGKNDYTPLFFAWFEMPDYRMPVPNDFKLTHDEIKLKEQFGLDDEQLQWRRYTIRNDFDGDEKLFRQEYPSTPEEAFLVTGRTVFNADKLDAMSHHTRKGERYTINELTGSIVPDERGELEVFRIPEEIGEYCIGADVAEGLPEGDYSAAYSIDAFTGEDCAVLHGHFDDDIFAKKLDALGRWYNTALLGVEVNNVGHSVVNVLLNYTFYPNLYYHDDYNSEAGKNETKPGWPTNNVTRPILVDELVGGIREGVWKINDANLVMEMKTFVKNSKGKPQAMGKGTKGGAKDDRVISYGIAHQMRLRRPPSSSNIMTPMIGSISIRR